MKNLYKIILIVIASITIAGCDKMLLDGDPVSNPEANFDYLWNDFDMLYGGFIVKQIDWDSLYTVYRPRIDKNSSDKELYDVLTGLLAELNDNHVFLLTDAKSNLKSFNSGIIGRLKTFSDFKRSVILTNYLSEIKYETENILYGKLNEDIGYIHMSIFDETEKYYSDLFDDIFTYMNNCKGIVFDIRNNEGGTDQLAMYIAGRFSNESKKAFNFKIRNGPSHTDFTDVHWYSVEPTGASKCTKPVMVLTHRFTISAAETFAMTMKMFEHVQIVGDSTSGAFSDYVRRELPNGWGYGVAVGEWRDSENRSYEGIGLPPDVVVLNNSTDIANGVDEVLETAMQLLH